MSEREMLQHFPLFYFQVVLEVLDIVVFYGFIGIL